MFKKIKGNNFLFFFFALTASNSKWFSGKNEFWVSHVSVEMRYTELQKHHNIVENPTPCPAFGGGTGPNQKPGSDICSVLRAAACEQACYDAFFKRH